jgi:hypothetical protein
MTRESLLRQIERNWNELQEYVATLSHEQLTRQKDAAGWTVQDHLMHIATWEKGTLALLNGKSKREAMDIPADIWAEDDDPINAIIHQRYQAMPTAEVIQTLEQEHERLMQKLGEMTEEDLQRPYRDYQPESDDEHPLLAYLVWDTVYHYRDHLPWMAAIAEKR